MKIIRTFFLQLILSITCISYVYAEDLASLLLEPKNPTPRSTVTITLQSYYFDVNLAKVSWKVNGIPVLQGTGEKKLTLQTGAVGEGKIVTVTAESSDGTSVEQSLTVTPSSVILLYEAPESYVPLLYEGRSLPSYGAQVRVSAFPQISDGGSMLSASSLSYTWYVNDKVMEDASGLGKQSANLPLNYLTSKTDLRVLIRTPLGNKTEKTITIKPHEVMPILYLYDQILGPIFTSPVEKRFETSKDFTLSLQPFYVSQKKEKSPTYEWFIDGLPSTPLGGRLLSLHPKENSYGSKMLTISVTGPGNYSEKTETKTELIFDTRK